MLLREFDERAGWNCGFLSCAHWLHWRTGIDLGAAREKVRVAKALTTLPRVSAAMQRGAISYAKVRALTRVATPQHETALLDFALAGTAAHVERFVRAWRRVDRVEAARETEVRHLRRELSTWVDDEGMVVIRGRLTPEIGAVVRRALEAAADRLFREATGAPRGATMAEDLTSGQRRADALGLLAETALAADLDRGTAGDRYQVVLHVEASRPTSGVLAPVVVMHHDPNGAVIDVGRQDAHNFASHSSRAARARHAVPVSGLLRTALRRPSCRALDRRRRNQPPEPRVAVPTSSSRGTRRRIHARATSRWLGDRSSSGRQATGGRSSPAAVGSRAGP